jgi:hypothetical protein
LFKYWLIFLADILEEPGMNSAVTEQLSYEQTAVFDREQLPATGEKWSRRRTIVFVIGASALLWTLIVEVVLGGF